MSCHYREALEESVYDKALQIFKKALEANIITEEEFNSYVQAKIEELP